MVIQVFPQKAEYRTIIKTTDENKKFQICHILAVRPEASYLTSQFPHL